MEESTFERVGDLVRKALDQGRTLEIEGLGTFQSGPVPAGSARQYRFVPQSGAQVFIAYAAEDLALARKLCEGLREAGCSPWIDKDMLLPGQNWPRAIERAIEISDVFIGCFSGHSILKRGQFQSELRYALDCARKRPIDETFVVPVRFEECAVPKRIADQVQYVDLFPDWEKGLKRVAKAVRGAARNRMMPALL